MTAAATKIATLPSDFERAIFHGVTVCELGE